MRFSLNDSRPSQLSILGPQPSWALRLSGAFVLALGCSSCGLADGFADIGSSLGNPDAALLDSPGRKLASGKFHNLLIDGSLGDGGHVIALRNNEGEAQRLAIIPYVDGEACFVEPAFAFDRLSSRIDVELSGIISLQETVDEVGKGPIRFLDFSCQELFAGLEGSSLPRVPFPANAPTGLLALAGNGELSLIDAKSQTIKPIAKGVSLARSAGEFLWTIENEKLVIRDTKLSQLDEVGDGVTEYATTGGNDVAVAFQDKAGLHVWSEAEGASLLSPTACAAVSWGVDTIAYFDPCEERRLNIYTLGSRIGAEEDFVKIVGPENTLSIDRGSVYWGNGERTTEFTFLAQGTSVEDASFVLGTIPADLQDLGMNSSPEDSPSWPSFNMKTKTLVESKANLRQSNIYKDWDGSLGTLLEIERDEDGEISGLLTVAKRVAQLPGGSAYSQRGVLANFKDGVGELRVFKKESDESILVAEQVPPQNQVVETETGRIAFVGDSKDGARGALYLTRAIDDGGTQKEPQVVDQNVIVDTVRFLEQPRALAYLVRPPDTDFVELRVWLLDSGLSLTIHKQVSEYRTVPWPAPGILYAVPEGKDQGLWFSKAR